MSPRPLPARIGRYEVIDRLGQGGMGVLYLARDPLLGRTVAIKVLSGYNEELRERFAREARSCAALSHVNIVTIFDVGDDHEQPFIAMEYLDGETMAEMIRRKASLPLTRKLQLMLELCSGLGYAHRLGIIHRDIKPANLMLTSMGVLKILDFGLARLTQEGSNAGLTQSGALLGTPHYMSPEQVEAGLVDQRSDIFSVGLVFYELLCYRKAYAGDAPHAVLHKITHEAPPPLRGYYPSVAPALEAIVQKAIERDPNQRYQNLETLAADCTRFLNSSASVDNDSTVMIARGTDSTPPPASPTPQDSRKDGTPKPTPRVSTPDAIAKRRAAQIQLHLDEAQRHFEAQKYEAAIEQCEIAVMLDPQEPRALQLLDRLRHILEEQQVLGWLEDARVRLSTGSLSEAEQLIQQSLQLRPQSPEAKALLRTVKDKRRELELAVERARAVRGAVGRARANLERGALEASLRSLTEALGHDPTDGEALQLREEVSAALERRQREQEHEQRALAASAEAHDHAARGDLEQARDLLRAFAPPHEIVDRNLADIEHQIEAAERRRREAEEAKRRREEEEAARRREAERVARELELERQRKAEEERRRLEAERQARLDESRESREEARLALERGDVPAASLALQRSRALTPDEPEIAALSGQIAAAQAAQEQEARRREAFEHRLAEAAGFLEQRDFFSALRSIDGAVKEIPGEPRAIELKQRIAAEAEAFRRAEDARRRADAVATKARRAFIAGDFAGAMRILDEFPEPELVAAVAGELRTEQAKRERSAEEARQKEAAAARAAEDARQRETEAARAAEERRAREAEEARLADVRRREEEQRRAADAARARDEAVRAREAEEARTRAEAERTREAEARLREELARRAEDEARRREAEEARKRDAEEARKRADEQRAREADARRREEEAREQERRRQEQEAKQQREAEKAHAQAEAEARRDAERRKKQAVREEEARRQRIQRALKDAERTDDHDEALAMLGAAISRDPGDESLRQAIAERERALAAARIATDTLVVEPAPVTPHAHTATFDPTHVRRRGVALIAIAAGIVVAAALAGWYVAFKPSGTDRVVVQKGDDHGTDPRAQIQQDVDNIKKQYRSDPTAGVKAAVEYYRKTPHGDLQQLLAEARTAARTGAAAAVSEAQKTASTQPSFQQASEKMKDADALQEPLDTERAIAMFRDAEQLANRARSEAINDPALAERVALDQYQKGQIPVAIQSALNARRLDPKRRAGVDLLTRIRRDAEQKAAQSKAKAADAGASSTDEFKRADAKLTEASRQSTPETTQAQVEAYADAQRLFDDSVAAAARDRDARHTEAERLVASGQSALASGNFDQADADAARALNLESTNAAALQLKSRIATGRRDNDVRLRNQRIATLVQQASATPNHAQAVGLLQQAYDLDRTREDVKKEMDRRRDLANTPPPPAKPSYEQENAAIQAVIEQYRAGYEKLDAAAVIRVAPFLNGTQLADAFKRIRTYSLRLSPDPAQIESSGRSATVASTADRTVVNEAGAPRRETPNYMFTLSKDASGRWTISKVTSR